MIDPNLAFAFIGAVGTGGVLWGASQAKLRSVTKSIDKMEGSLSEHVAADHQFQLENVQRLASLETMVKEIHNSVVK